MLLDSIARTFRRDVVSALLIWLVATALAVSWWSLLMVGTESDPMNYALARSYYGGQASPSGLPPAVARQRLAEIRGQVFHWIVAEVRFPVLLSVLAIPLLALLVGWAPSDRWAVLLLALALAFFISTGAFIWYKPG